jgi:hypothetical protein
MVWLTEDDWVISGAAKSNLIPRDIPGLDLRQKPLKFLGMKKMAFQHPQGVKVAGYGMTGSVFISKIGIYFL